MPTSDSGRPSETAPLPGRRGGVCVFGPYRLDPQAKTLRRDGVDVQLPLRALELLTVFVTSAGEVVSKDRLMRAAWQDVIVGENSLEKVLSALRRVLDPDAPVRYIETVARRGYRFVAPVEWIAAAPPAVDISALLAPHRVWLEGLAALETFARDEIGRAKATFEALVAAHDHDAGYHVCLANACALLFESTRADAEPDLAALRQAEVHARRACELRPDSGDGWAVLGFVLERTGARLEAPAALRRATQLEPGIWRHYLRLAAGSWGEERVLAATHVLRVRPDLPFARLLVATVYVARESLDAAEAELDAGLRAMPEGAGPSRASAVALSYTKGLLCLARDDVDGALACFARELAGESRGHFYARECCANTWCAMGAVHLKLGDRAAARTAFTEALARIATHPTARAGLALVTGERPSPFDLDAPLSLNAAVARAVLLVADGDVPAAVQLVDAALAASPPGSAGWTLPIEPFLGVARAREAWRPVLDRLLDRAT